MSIMERTVLKCHLFQEAFPDPFIRKWTLSLTMGQNGKSALLLQHSFLRSAVTSLYSSLPSGGLQALWSRVCVSSIFTISTAPGTGGKLGPNVLNEKNVPYW